MQGSPLPQQGTARTVYFPGTPWEPRVEGVSLANHDPNTRLVTEEYTARGQLVAPQERVDHQHIFTFTVPMHQELGPAGSLSLVAESSFQLAGGYAYSQPVLISLSDGVHEYVHLQGEDHQECFEGGGEQWLGSHHQCSIQQPSIFQDRDHWLEANFYAKAQNDRGYVRLGGGSGRVSVTTLPTCNSTLDPEHCVFNSHFFVGDQLRSGPGVQYTAKYILVSSARGHRSATRSAVHHDPILLRLKVLKKFAAAPATKAIDLNVVIVGNNNIFASRSPRGQANLNQLFAEVYRHLNQPNVEIKIGRIRVTEWAKDPISPVHPFENFDINHLNALFEHGSQLIQSENGAREIPIYLVDTLFARNHPQSSFQTLGITNLNPAPATQVNAKSGIAIATHGLIQNWNPRCATLSHCPALVQDPGFIKEARTVSQNIALYLGLRHTYEPFTEVTDRLSDTPKCVGGSISDLEAHRICLTHLEPHPLTQATCAEVCHSYNGQTEHCSQQPECAFNYLMWPWTSDTTSGLEDGVLISPAGGVILNASPWVY